MLRKSLKNYRQIAMEGRGASSQSSRKQDVRSERGMHGELSSVGAMLLGTHTGDRMVQAHFCPRFESGQPEDPSFKILSNLVKLYRGIARRPWRGSAHLTVAPPSWRCSWEVQGSCPRSRRRRLRGWARPNGFGPLSRITNATANDAENSILL